LAYLSSSYFFYSAANFSLISFSRLALAYRRLISSYLFCSAIALALAILALSALSAASLILRSLSYSAASALALAARSYLSLSERAAFSLRTISSAIRFASASLAAYSSANFYFLAFSLASSIPLSMTKSRVGEKAAGPLISKNPKAHLRVVPSFQVL
jgi:hypothetical protein